MALASALPAADVLKATEGQVALVVTHSPAEIAELPAVKVSAGRSVSATERSVLDLSGIFRLSMASVRIFLLS
ncbi:hypothetical protein [Amycolatopsis tolypomycina]|uniref:Uncharacterized protein n=1 Tax=Amycolatopsis tolypomycina TaxID=208445 RepID=A0A1H4U9M8_9PSEU|nr:hypothetical protein [Amycolatopsis tolypomycina]SEC65158.1 hypothetical protein SAMN04489727_4548 [Amycolatopsis tolypomycina]